MLVEKSKPFFVNGGVYYFHLSNGKTIVARVSHMDAGDIFIVNPKIVKKNGNMENHPNVLRNSVLKLGTYSLASKVEDDNFISVYEQYIENY
jgi:hypothetical protein